jgi:Tfp pilus assembly protein PilW
VLNISREDGFTITEMMVSTVVMLMVVGGAMTTFKNALAVNDTAAQLGDTNQNLRAGTNQLTRDVLMAGRIIGTNGISMPTGPGITFARPGPAGLNFDLVADGDPTLQLPSISTGYQKGAIINGSSTDMITIMTVDEFMPVVTTPPLVAGTPTPTEGTISPDGTSITFAANAQWMVGDTVADTPKIQIGDLVLFVGQDGNAIQTVTAIDATHITFASADPNDFFHFNQPNATNQVAGTGRPLSAVKQVGSTLCAPAVLQTSATAWCAPVTLFKALMITYYVDNTTTPGTPRLTRVLNHFTPQALAGIVEDLDLTYDLYDGVTNPTGVTSLPAVLAGVTYSESMIRKVNLHVGVRSETLSKPNQDYVRNHITTSVNVRSLAAVDRYVSQ